MSKKDKLIKQIVTMASGMDEIDVQQCIDNLELFKYHGKILLKTGKLKHNLYCYKDDDMPFQWGESYTKSEVGAKINKLKENYFELIPKGTEFFYFKAYGNDRTWENANEIVCDRDNKWAKKHLVGIKDV